MFREYQINLGKTFKGEIFQNYEKGRESYFGEFRILWKDLITSSKQ